MSRYEISVEVTIKECEGPVDANPVEQADGSFRPMISDETAGSIDDCEQALPRTDFAPLRSPWMRRDNRDRSGRIEP